ncbi:MAG TPA: hypothetical protein VID29_09735 [Solirubrobacteraceae bacterium]|jgi:hypothetical protein
MHTSPIRRRTARAVRSLSAVTPLFALLALLVFVAPARAVAPASVTVEVEGLTETKVPPTLLRTTTTPVVKNNGEGHPEGSCSGTSAIGALELATGGNWSGPWSSNFNQYEIFTIAGETHQFEAGSKANYYWSFWLDHKEASVGACEAQLAQGDQVLFFPACFGKECPPSPTPLGIEAPVLANVGEAVSVTVSQYNAKGEPSPAVGADVAGGGVNATADLQGHATLRFAGDGTYTLHAYEATGGPAAVRTQTTICVHEGNDGTCGTQAPAGSVLAAGQSATTPFAPTPAYTGPYAVVAQASGVLDGHVYALGQAPKVLAGRAIAHTAIGSVSIELRRSYRGRCWDYDAKRARFLDARCGTARFFAVATGASFSYLLPAPLLRGRYVFDIRAVDAAGHRAPLDRGSSRIVFYVR